MVSKDLIGFRAEIKAKYDEAVARRDAAKEAYEGIEAKIADIEEFLQMIEGYVSTGKPLGRPRRAAAGAFGALLFLSAAMGSSAYADCVSTPDRIDARCYPDLQTATAAAISANEPLWLPAGTYVLSQPWVVDYAPVSGTGFRIISDGAVVDATAAIPIGPAVAIQCSGGTTASPKSCFYFHIQGTLFVNANTTGSALRFGLNDFSDAHNSAKVDHLVVNNANPAATAAVRLNYVLNADMFVVGDSAGGVGLLLEQTQFSRISGAASATNGTALMIQDGYSFANTFQALDLEVAQTCLQIDSPYVNRNTFVSPYFNCPTPIVATAGERNLLINPSWGASGQTNGLVGIVILP